MHKLNIKVFNRKKLVNMLVPVKLCIMGSRALSSLQVPLGDTLTPLGVSSFSGLLEVKDSILHSNYHVNKQWQITSVELIMTSYSFLSPNLTFFSLKACSFGWEQILPAFLNIEYFHYAKCLRVWFLTNLFHTVSS